ncbi:MAG TPA: hypothetical protein VGD56_22470, partial [Gemmatirosa sp.]
AKRDILDRFEQKLAAAEATAAALADGDWDGVRLILDALRQAFHPADERALIESERADAQERRATQARYATWFVEAADAGMLGDHASDHP